MNVKLKLHLYCLGKWSQIFFRVSKYDVPSYEYVRSYKNIIEKGTCCVCGCGVFSSKHWDPLLYGNFQVKGRNGNYLDKNKTEASWSVGWQNLMLMKVCQNCKALLDFIIKRTISWRYLSVNKVFHRINHVFFLLNLNWTIV